MSLDNFGICDDGKCPRCGAFMTHFNGEDLVTLKEENEKLKAENDNLKEDNCRWQKIFINPNRPKTIFDMENPREIMLQVEKLEWQPAETAPRDDNKFLAYIFEGGLENNQDSEINLVWWEPSENSHIEGSNSDGDALKVKIKYWLPLSALPPIPEEKPKLKIMPNRFYKNARNEKCYIGFDRRNLQPLAPIIEYPYEGEILDCSFKRWVLSLWNEKGGSPHPNCNLVAYWTDEDERELQERLKNA